MKTLIAILLLLGLSTNWSALGGGAGLNVPQTSQGDGILKSIQNAGVTQSGEDLVVTRKDARTPIELVFMRCQGLGVQYQDNQWWVGWQNANVLRQHLSNSVHHQTFNRRCNDEVDRRGQTLAR